MIMNPEEQMNISVWSSCKQGGILEYRSEHSDDQFSSAVAGPVEAQQNPSHDHSILHSWHIPQAEPQTKAQPRPSTSMFAPSAAAGKTSVKTEVETSVCEAHLNELEPSSIYENLRPPDSAQDGDYQQPLEQNIPEPFVDDDRERYRYDLADKIIRVYKNNLDTARRATERARVAEARLLTAQEELRRLQGELSTTSELVTRMTRRALMAETKLALTMQEVRRRQENDVRR